MQLINKDPFTPAGALHARVRPVHLRGHDEDQVPADADDGRALGRLHTHDRHGRKTTHRRRGHRAPARFQNA